MTLGPMFVLLGLVEGLRKRVSQVLFSVLGRVPFFYYLLHIPLIHLLACGVSLIRELTVNPAQRIRLIPSQVHTIGPAPDGYTWHLWLLYLVWLVLPESLMICCTSAYRW